jgi:hypothetical protein
MQDGITARDRTPHCLGVAEVSEHRLDLRRRMVRRFDQVENAGFVARQTQSVDDVRADESGRARDEDSHDSSSAR